MASYRESCEFIERDGYKVPVPLLTAVAKIRQVYVVSEDTIECLGDSCGQELGDCLTEWNNVVLGVPQAEIWTGHFVVEAVAIWSAYEYMNSGNGIVEEVPADFEDFVRTRMSIIDDALKIVNFS